MLVCNVHWTLDIQVEVLSDLDIILGVMGEKMSLKL